MNDSISFPSVSVNLVVVFVSIEKDGFHYLIVIVASIFSEDPFIDQNVVNCEIIDYSSNW